MSGSCACLIKKLSTPFARHCVGCRRPINPEYTAKHHLEVELKTKKDSSDKSRERLQNRQLAHLKD